MFITITVDSWDDAKKLNEELGSCLFRGHADANWRLSSGLERNIQSYELKSKYINNREQYTFREFKRRAHHYLNNLPDETELFEWLALIQHHGGATRLLDFSLSFYVAAFFAMDNASKDAAVWAINHFNLIECIHTLAGVGTGDEYLSDSYQQFADIAKKNFNGENPNKMVLAIEPERMNERLSIQQGLFLYPCDITAPFEDNLAETLKLPLKTFDNKEVINFKFVMPEMIRKASVVKIIVPREVHSIALYDLRSMNISSATLFPGLDGFARSLNLYFRMYRS
jgi:hypothetical protein